MSCASARSRVTRPAAQQAMLSASGDEIYVLQLQGYVFFGTADRLVSTVRSRIQNASLPRPRVMILDFRRITGMDSSALLSFRRLLQIVSQEGVSLLLTEVKAGTRRQLEQGELHEQPPTLQYLPDLDHGLEWSENSLLAAHGVTGDEPGALREQMARITGDAALVDRLLAHFDCVEVAAGEYLMREGEEPDTLFLLDEGQVTAQLERAGREPIRLETMMSGRVVGEMGFYQGRARSASVVVDRPGRVYRLTHVALARMETEEPELASALHRVMVSLLADRVSHLARAVEALQR
jgi:SulP family sulfate permease